MKKQLKKLTLNRETLRDLTAQNAGEVKGGAPKSKKNCPHPPGGGGTLLCTITCYVTYCGC